MKFYYIFVSLCLDVCAFLESAKPVVIMLKLGFAYASVTDLFFEFSNFMCALHNGLLCDRLVFLQYYDLLLHVIVLTLLLGNTSLKVLEVGHDVRIDHFNILVVLGREVIFHQAYFLSQHLDLFLIFAERLLALGYPLLNSLAMTFDVIFDWNGDLGSVGA